MYQFKKKISNSTYIAQKDNEQYILKQISSDDVASFRKLINVKSKFLAKVFEIVVIEDKIYAVIEYIEGTSLTELLEQNGCFSPKQTAKICIDVCSGLEDMHQIGIIHRDINPNNIILRKTGDACIIDYGICRITKKTKTRDTYIMGTPGYASPEQFGFQQTDVKSDIYSVGILANYLLCRKYPNELLEKSKISFVIDRCIKINPQDRYKTITEVKHAFSSASNRYFSDDYPIKIPIFTKVVHTILFVLMILYSALFTVGDLETFKLINFTSVITLVGDLSLLFIPLHAYFIYFPKYTIYYMLTPKQKAAISAVIVPVSVTIFAVITLNFH